MNRAAMLNSSIGEYRVTDCLGAGGMGEVYRAVHQKAGQVVAVKILLQESHEAPSNQRFAWEAQVQARLNHPNIAAFHSLTEHQGCACIVMEYVDGQTLSDRVRFSGPLPMGEALAIFQAVVEAVVYIHAQGIIHRDLKSNNIKITSDGRVKLLDFGIASSALAPKMTMTGMVVGALESLSPEQLQGQRADERSDIWALGVLLYEMVTGRMPFEAQSIGEICSKTTKGTYAPPKALNPSITREVETLITRCLKKHPADRCQSAAAFRPAKDPMNMITRWKKLTAPPAEAALLRPHPTSPGDRTVFSPDFEITAGSLSDAGCRRETNEDCCRFIKPEEPEQLNSKGHLALVCDGMGGHAGGEVASRMAVEIITRTYCKSSKPPQAALEEAFQSANRAIHKTSQKHPHLGGMGTTCTALVLHQGEAILAQIGDSRLYLAREGQIYLMSEDHSAVMEMVRRGAMSLEEARRHEDKNIILRALGVQPEIAVSAWQTPFPVQDQDCFVLCSDGLYDLVTDEEIGQTVCDSDPQPATERLVVMAKERGGYDNISVVVIKLAHVRTMRNEERKLPPTREFEQKMPIARKSSRVARGQKFLQVVSRIASRLHMCE